MKPTGFFIEKGESFLEQLRAIELVSFHFNEAINDIYDGLIGRNSSEFTNQTIELQEFKFQMNLMFSEFDNGELFSKKLNGFKTNTVFDNKPYLEHLVNINELFIDYLDEYRVEK